MAPRREQKKRMGKKHRQASTRPKQGKTPKSGARTGAQIAAASPKGRKALGTKKAAAEKAKRVPARSPEFEHHIVVGDMEEPGAAEHRTSQAGSGTKKDKGGTQLPSGNDSQTDGGEARVSFRNGSKDLVGRRRESYDEIIADDSRYLVRGAAAPNESGVRRAVLGEAMARAPEPLIAICGRPNVGKSTLFNRLTGTRRSIVGDEPGITRDRIYGEVEWNGREVRLVDTGGVIPDDEALIPSEIFRQARVALDEADAIVMVIDGRTEITAADREFSRLLIRTAKPLFLAVNKMDTAQLEAGAENFRVLGFKNVLAISAEHGSGIGDLLDAMWEALPPAAGTEHGAEAEGTAHGAGIGHPAPDGEEPEAVLDTQDGELAEDEGDLLADRAVLEPRAMYEAMLEGEAATADEFAGVDAPPIGEVDYEAPTGGDGQEPEDRDVAAESEEEQRERRLRTHGEHVQRETKVAIIGRPNVGKSTLLNALTGTERAIVSPIAGTTRDAVDEVVTRDGHDFRFIDTAGIRRKGKTTQMAEKLSVIMSRKHLEAADVALLVIDATEGVTGSDATIGGYAHESGRSVIIVVNKWDLVAPPKHKLNEDGTRALDGKPPAEKKLFEEQVRDHLKYLDYAPLLFVSAAEGKGLDQVFKKVELVARERRKRITTGNMNRFLDRVDFGRASVPMNKRLRIYYMTQAAVAPPTFVLFTDRDVRLHFSYERFLTNEIRKAFKFIGSPIWFKIKARNKKKDE